VLSELPISECAGACRQEWLWVCGRDWSVIVGLMEPASEMITSFSMSNQQDLK